MSFGVASATIQVALFIGLASTGLLFGSQAEATEKLVDGIAAQVGSEIVLISEVREIAAPFEERMRAASVPEAEIHRMHADALERLIEGRLIDSVVRRLELEATSNEIDAAIQGIAEDTGLSLQDLAKSVSSHGLTFEEYREKIGSEIERNKVLNSMVRSQVRIEPKEVEALYAERFSDQRQTGEEFHIFHLLVAIGPPPQHTMSSACEIVASGAERIRSGEASFGEVAREISDVNAATGGDMGWLHKGDLASWMDPIVSRLEPGQLSDAIETRFGCNLLKLQAQREFSPVSFEDARAELENEVFQRKTEKQYVTWLEELRAQTYIDRRPIDPKALSYQD